MTKLFFFMLFIAMMCFLYVAAPASFETEQPTVSN